MVPDVSALLGLWHGDDRSDGYISVKIVVEVCRVTGPASWDSLRLKFYPGISEDKIPDDELEVLKKGYELWCGHLRHQEKAA